MSKLETAAKQLSYFQLFCLAVFFRVVCVICYRLYFHPLKSFPGPRLAAITDFYQGYHALWKNGRFVKHVEELHRIYGPVVRVRPNELHFCTPDAYFAIYPAHTGFNKDPFFYNRFPTQNTAFGMLDAEEHKKRRDILSPLFSRQAILRLEEVVQDKVNLFIDQIRQHSGEPIDFFRGFQSLAMDVVSAYCFAHTFGALATSDFNHPILRAIQGAETIGTVAQYFPILRLLYRLPVWLGTMLNPGMAGLGQIKNVVKAQVDRILEDPDALMGVEHETIYHRFIMPDVIKTKEAPSRKALIEEAMVILAAGTDTTSKAMTVGLFHLLNDKSAWNKLQGELQAAWPDKDTSFSFQMAEKLSYLTGVIKEALRLSVGVTTTLPRVATSATVIDGFAVPAGTVVGVSHQFILRAPDMFPDPLAFKPERWMGPDSLGLDKYLIVFSRGPRSCLGMNLVWCELYLTFAHLVRKFDIKLYELGAEDMAFRDHTVKDTKPLRALAKEKAA